MSKLPSRFYELMNYEGVVSIVTWTSSGPHLTNTWNTYIQLNSGEDILIPVGGMYHLRQDLQANKNILLSIGAREVEGLNGYQGTGIRVEGYGTLIEEGRDFLKVKEKHPWIKAVLVIEVVDSKVLL